MQTKGKFPFPNHRREEHKDAHVMQTEPSGMASYVYNGYKNSNVCVENSMRQSDIRVIQSVFTEDNADVHDPHGSALESSERVAIVWKILANVASLEENVSKTSP